MELNQAKNNHYPRTASTFLEECGYKKKMHLGVWVILLRNAAWREMLHVVGSQIGTTLSVLGFVLANQFLVYFSSVVFSPLALKINLHFRLLSICLLSFVFAEEDSFRGLNWALVSWVGLYLLSLHQKKYSLAIKDPGKKRQESKVTNGGRRSQIKNYTSCPGMRRKGKMATESAHSEKASCKS